MAAAAAKAALEWSNFDDSQSTSNCVLINGNVPVTFRDGQVSYVGQECKVIPREIADAYGYRAVRLDLSFNSLRTLDGLGRFTILQELIVDNNELEEGITFPYNPKLRTLSMNKNRFEDLESLITSLARNYPTLTYFSLLGNPACPDQLTNANKDEEDYQRYRYFVIHRLKCLQFLDSRPVTLLEKTEAKRVGPLMKMSRPVMVHTEEEAQEDAFGNVYSPLPRGAVPHQAFKSAYGVLRYRYTGKHSEGNRFIRNNEL